MLKHLFTLLRVKLWYLTVGKWKKYQARKRLAAFVAKLSPEKQAQANALRAKLDSQTPAQAAQTLIAEAARLTELQFRAIESIDRLHRSLEK